jgi:hypothetical protein
LDMDRFTPLRTSTDPNRFLTSLNSMNGEVMIYTRK